MTREQHIQLSDACDFLEWYHGTQRKETITRFRGKFADIYVVSDRPEGMRDTLRDITEEYVEP